MAIDTSQSMDGAFPAHEEEEEEEGRGSAAAAPAPPPDPTAAEAMAALLAVETGPDIDDLRAMAARSPAHRAAALGFLAQSSPALAWLSRHSARLLSRLLAVPPPQQQPPAPQPAPRPPSAVARAAVPTFCVTVRLAPSLGAPAGRRSSPLLLPGAPSYLVGTLLDIVAERTAVPADRLQLRLAGDGGAGLDAGATLRDAGVRCGSTLDAHVVGGAPAPAGRAAPARAALGAAPGWGAGCTLGRLAPGPLHLG